MQLNTSSEANDTEEVAGVLAVDGGNAAILLELAEELHNQMPCPVQPTLGALKWYSS